MIEPVDLGIPGLTNIERIGSGGNAVVYRAQQQELDRSVVVKVLTNIDAETTRRRFDRERRAMGRLSQTYGIAPLYGSGLTPTGQPYLLMPFYEQGSLQDRLVGRGALPATEVRDIGVTIAKAVQIAHENGVLHRDIKPANILMSKTGRPDVADFGIARLVDDALGTSQALTMTPLYTAPEVFDGVDSGASADVYSLGATLFALLNGFPAYGDPSGGTPVLSLMRRINEDPLPALPDSVPPQLAKVVAKAMSKNPQHRHASAAELAVDLTGASFEPSGRTNRRAARDSSVSGDRPRRSPKIMAGAAAAALLLGGVIAAAVFLLPRGDTDPEVVTAPQPTQQADEPQRPTPTALAMPDDTVDAEPAGFRLTAAVSAAKQVIVRVESFSCAGADVATGVLLPDGIVVTSGEVMAVPWQIEVSSGGQSVTATPATTASGLAFITIEEEMGEELPGVSVAEGETVAIVGRDGRPALATVLDIGDDATNMTVELQEGSADTVVEPVDVVVTDSGGLVGIALVLQDRVEVVTPERLQQGASAAAPVWGCDSTERDVNEPESAVAPLIEELLTMQQLSDAYASEQWTAVQAYEPAKRSYTAAQFIAGWRPLRQGFVYPVAREIDGDGLVSWRIGLIGHETWGGSDLTTLFCVTWKLDPVSGGITQTLEDAVTVFGSLGGTPRQNGFVDPGDLRSEITEQCPVAS